MASAKAGRRSNAKTLDGDVDVDMMGEFGDKPSRKAVQTKSGWGAESAGDQSGEMTTGYTEAEAEPDIPMIPELPSDTMTSAEQVARAPLMASRVATIGELTSDLQKQASYSIIDGEIDISLIAKYVRSDKEVVEPDEVWEWDQVFADVASDLRQNSMVLEAVELTTDSKGLKTDEKEKEKEKEKEREREIEREKEKDASKPSTAAPKGRRQKQPGQTSTIFDE